MGRLPRRCTLTRTRRPPVLQNRKPRRAGAIGAVAHFSSRDQRRRAISWTRSVCQSGGWIAHGMTLVEYLRRVVERPIDTLKHAANDAVERVSARPQSE